MHVAGLAPTLRHTTTQNAIPKQTTHTIPSLYFKCQSSSLQSYSSIYNVNIMSQSARQPNSPVLVACGAISVPFSMRPYKRKHCAILTQQ